MNTEISPASRRTELSDSKKGLLEKRLRGAFKAAAPVIPRRFDHSPAPLSFAQQRLWFIHQLEPDSPAYNVPTALRLQGPIKLAALQQSLNEIIQRHEILRTTFPADDGTPMQVVSPVVAFSLSILDLAGRPDPESCLQRLITEEAQRPFQLARGPLIRGTLLRLAEEDHVLLLNLHHMISDGWSMAVFFRELQQIYEGICAGLPPRLPELPIQYADFASWQQQ